MRRLSNSDASNRPLTRRGSIDVIRMAIEKGQQLDPALIEKLTSNEHRAGRIDPLRMKLGSIITIASGIGVCLMAMFMAGVAPWAFYPIFGAGLVMTQPSVSWCGAGRMRSEICFAG
jgi:hypothetical protein